MADTCALQGKGCIGVPSLRITFSRRKYAKRDRLEFRLVCGRCFGKAMTKAHKWVKDAPVDAWGRTEFRKVTFSGLAKQ